MNFLDIQRRHFFLQNVHKLWGKQEMPTENKQQCQYKFQDKDKFNGMPYCTFFNQYCEDVSFICDENCEVFELHKKVAHLENLLKMSERHNNDIVKQNQSLQSELRFVNDNNKKDDSYIVKLEESNMLLETENEKFKQALEKIREINIECKGCNGDCTFCMSGTNQEIYNISTETLGIKE